MSSSNTDNVQSFEQLPSLKETIAQYNLLAKKSLGQNFILDENLLDRIVRSAGSLKDKVVIEIGPGPGGLTRAALRSDAARIVAIEKDDRCLPILDALKQAAQSRLHIIHADALKTPITTLTEGQPYHIVANLPYNIGTKLLAHWLEDLSGCHGMTLMFQKEVAERLCAIPGNKSYGRLSILVQWLCQARIAFEVPPSAFIPKPKVNSAIVHLTPRPQPLAEADAGILQTLTAQAFNQRRKMLRASLKGLVPGSIEVFLTALNIDPTSRPEQVDIRTWCAMARAVATQQS